MSPRQPAEKPTEPKASPPARAAALLRDTRAQVALLGGLLAAVVVAIIAIDTATGGDTEPPPPLGEAIAITPGSRVIVIPTLAPIETVAPPPPVPTEAPPIDVTPSTAGDALQRDDQRVDALAELQDALEEYRDDNDDYPSTNGNIQTLCAYKELDAGCELEDVVDEDVLIDPLGDPLENGYWYQSDGESYTVWTLREGAGAAGDPVCPEVPDHLRSKGALFCVRGE